VVRDASGRGTRGLWIGSILPDQIERDAQIVANKALKNGGTGIVYTGIGGDLTDNRSSQNRGAGIVIAGGPAARSEWVRLIRNTCEGNGYHGIQCDVVVNDPVAFPLSCLVERNICVRNTYSGIFAARSSGWRIFQNTCLDNAAGGSFSDGITLDSYCLDVIVAQNHCADRRPQSERTQANGVSCVANGAPGMLTNICIESNILENHREAGIILAANGLNDIRGGVLRANTCRDNAVGIRLRATSGGQLLGLTLEANLFRQNGRQVESNF
jgi:parallel beta-helix repeat protein